MGYSVVYDEKSTFTKDSLDVRPPRQILRAFGIEKDKVEASFDAIPQQCGSVAGNLRNEHGKAGAFKILRRKGKFEVG
jgi:hypothetical protein